ncbi:hypothetical protein VU12_12540 [Desulfobulbus sp. US4]|nr:hypothetical protein [Desulfobulbus sp. US4]
MITAEGWGREQGRTVYGKMIDFIEKNPGITAFQISFEGVRRMDFSFASESLVELARRYCGHKGFYLSEPIDADIVENVGAAAEKKKQPLIVWDKEEYRIIGMSPSRGAVNALNFALQRETTRAAEFIKENKEITIANASMKFKQLWQQGFLLRREDISESGGVEYVYYRIK